MGVKGLSPKLTIGFKPKRKLVFKPKVDASLCMEAKGVKSTDWKLLEKVLSPTRQASTSSCRALTPSWASISACELGCLCS